MKLRIYRTLWGVLEETDGEKVCYHFVIIFIFNGIILLYNKGIGDAGSTADFRML